MMFRLSSIRTSVSIIALIGVCTFVPVLASAQVQGHSFSPISGWTVGTTDLASVRGLQGVQLPCVLSTEYDNGYVVRFSGGGNQMLALAMDFRQNVFNRGQKYSALLGVGGGYVKQVSASAFTPGILLFNLRDMDDIYSALKNAKQFSLDVEGNSFTFSLQQMGQNFASLEACYSTGQATKIQPVSTAYEGSIDAANSPSSLALPAPVQKHALPKTFDDIMTVEPETPAAMLQNNNVGMRRSDAVAPPTGSVSRATKAKDVAPVQFEKSATWVAKSGENIRTVLARWAGIAQYDLQWQADTNGEVVQDISVNGSFEEAVSQLLAENRAATGISGKFDDGRKSLSSDLWSAGAGDDLQAVLKQWAGQAGVSVVWKDSAGIPPLRAPVRTNSFEEAVQSALDQYSEDLRRPVAQLNTDPQTKKRTLLMDIEDAS